MAPVRARMLSVVLAAVGWTPACASNSPADAAGPDGRLDAASIDALRSDTPTSNDIVIGDTPSACAPGHVLCGPVCVDARNDPFNCGACGNACPGAANASAICTAGSCGITCSAGYGNCDGSLSDGCEADLSTRTNCGACGNACTGATACASGLCMACAAGTMLCPSGACSDLRTDPNNCGTCGHSCAASNAMVACVAGACSITGCGLGFGDCNHVVSDGCETTIEGDPSDCGACGNACPSTPDGTATCASGTCGFACDTGYHLCGTQCRSDTSGTSCGTSCTPCPTPPNTMATCTSAACGYECSPGFADCDGVASNGCEAALTQPSHCGNCSTVCSGSTPMCTVTSGGLACSSGCIPATLTSCSGSCVDTSTSVTNCGTCGHACSFAHAAAACAAGICQLGACSPGWGNCDGNATNGCETSLSANPADCGSCGHTCPTGSTCTGTACTCPAGLMLCATGCVDTTVNRNDCGACGRVCTGSLVCCDGICETILICERE